MQHNILACGIGEAPVDVSLNVSMKNLRMLNLKKDDSVYLDLEQRRVIRKFLTGKKPIAQPGGSVANSIHMLSMLCNETAFIGCIGKDNLGDVFYKDLLSHNVNVSCGIYNYDTQTSVCYVFITPDAERTFAVYRDKRQTINLDSVSKDFIASSNYLILEMYLTREPLAYNEMLNSINIAKKANSKIVVTLSNKNIVRQYYNKISQLVGYADIVFANLSEAMTFLKTKSKNEVISNLLAKNDDKEYVITLGKDGALSIYNGQMVTAQAFKVNPVDTTGAGDIFLSTYLYSKSLGLSKEETLKKACYLSSKVICQQGTRLKGDIKKMFEEVKI